MEVDYDNFKMWSINPTASTKVTKQILTANKETKQNQKNNQLIHKKTEKSFWRSSGNIEEMGQIENKY